MSTRTVGTCGRCGGAVTVPMAWLGVYPPTPQCCRCGATPKQSHGPILDMEPSDTAAVGSRGLHNPGDQVSLPRRRISGLGFVSR